MRLLDTCVLSSFIRPGAREKWPRLCARVDEILAEGLTLAYVTTHELRRGLELELERTAPDSSARVGIERKLTSIEKLVEDAEVLGLDADEGEGWRYATTLFVQLKLVQPAKSLSDGDLFIAATAAYHRRPFVTCDAGIAKNLQRIALPVEVELLALG